MRSDRQATRALSASPIRNGRSPNPKNDRIYAPMIETKWSRRLRLHRFPMPNPKPLETAVSFWAGKVPAETIAELTSRGIHTGQLGIPGDFALTAAPKWQ